MKKKFAIYLALASSALLTLSCGGNAPSSSSSLPADSSSSSSSAGVSSSSSSPQAVSLEKAFANTSSYALVPTTNSSFVLEYLSKQIYYYYFNGGGLIVLDDDSAYAHEFGLKSVELGDDKTHFAMDVHGIVNYATGVATYNAKHGFVYTLSSYLDDFTQSKDDPYLFTCDVTALAKTCRNYFEAQSFSYCDHFEIRTNAAGRLDTFTLFETDNGTHYAVASIRFAELALTDFEPYSLWVNEGKPINMRILDYKSIGSGKWGTVFFYEGKSATISGTVSAIDADGNVYLSAMDNSTGPVGIRMVLAETEKKKLALYDQVTVAGTITHSNYEVYLKDATVSSVSSDKAATLPAYDEEPLTSSYGDGVYAAKLFSQAPYYMGSLYDFECYVSSVTVGSESDAYSSCVLIFPDYLISDTARMTLSLKIEKSLANYASIMATLSSAVVYGETNPTKLAINNGLVVFDSALTDYSYTQIRLTDGSSVEKALTPLEKAQAILGNTSFTLPLVSDTSEKATAYHIGVGTSESVEALYGLKGTTPAYKYSIYMTSADYTSYQSALTTDGFILQNKIRDTGGAEHLIYKSGTAVVDMTMSESMGGSNILTLYLYQSSTYLHGVSFKEQLAAKIPSGFAIDDYVQLPGSYESDYSLFQLTNYAGNDYSATPYLVTCVSLHGDQSAANASLATLISSYASEGYVPYVDANGNSKNYKTRGATHRVYSKNGIVVDLSVYPTSDYTFSGSEEFTFRIEVAIYKESDYKAPTFLTDTSAFKAQVIADLGAEAGFELTLTGGSYYEIYRMTKNASTIDYGYGYSSDVFFYPGEETSLGGLLKVLESAIVAGGYSLLMTTAAGNDVYNQTLSDGSMAFLYVIKNKTNCIRILIGVGGTRF